MRVSDSSTSLITALTCIDFHNGDLGLAMRDYDDMPERSIEYHEKDGLPHTESTIPQTDNGQPGALLGSQSTGTAHGDAVDQFGNPV